jgi:radical SAM protein with 4Fe4S-binding SPASM domain
MPKKQRNNFFTLQWHITEKCNLKCKHCYQDENYIKEELKLKEKKSLIDQFVFFCSKINKIPRISFTGGEPFLIKKELYSLLEYCQRKYPFIRKSILTNGTLINIKDIPKLKLYKIDYVQISLDGATPQTHDFIRGKGNFNKAIRALRLLIKNNIKTAVMFVFHKKNYHEVPQLIDLCDKLGVDRLGITEFVPTGRGKVIKNLMLSPLETKKLYIQIAEKQEKLIKNKRKLKIDMRRPLWVLIRNKFPKIKHMIGGGCAAGFSGLAVLPNGDVMPCRRMNLIIGNIKNQTFFEIWYSSDILWKLRERDKWGECSRCEYLKRCYGCKALSLALYRNYLKRDPLCFKNDV